MSFEAHPHELRRVAALIAEAEAAILTAGDALSRVVVPPDPRAGEGPDLGAAMTRFARVLADETYALKVASGQLASGLLATAAQDEETDRETARALRHAGSAVGR